MSNLKDFAIVARPDNKFIAVNITGLTDEQAGDMLTERFGDERFLRAQAETAQAAIESISHEPK